jgi:TrmH family RNA methyltransferase
VIPHLDVVLVSPRNPLNIGAVARAMANFGFERLIVVSPHASHWQEARSAVGADDLLKSARECATLAEAIAEATLVVGTGSTNARKPEQQLVHLPALPAFVSVEAARGGRIALVFGPENHGLTREDLSRCHLIVEIPTAPRQPSMNLGQAAAVCLYELVAHASRQPLMMPGTAQPAAASGRLDLLAGVIEQTMIAARYSPRSMEAANAEDLRLFLRRIAPSEDDTRRILGLFRRILWRLPSPKQD